MKPLLCTQSPARCGAPRATREPLLAPSHLKRGKIITPLHSQFIINTLVMPLNLTVSQHNVYYSAIVKWWDLSQTPKIQSNCIQVWNLPKQPNLWHFLFFAKALFCLCSFEIINQMPWLVSLSICLFPHLASTYWAPLCVKCGVRC